MFQLVSVIKIHGLVCFQSRTPEVMSNYLDLTGDLEGVSGTAPDLTGKCYDAYFWLAPGCRTQPSTCLIWFTGGNGWGMFELLLKATAYNMPVATAVASSFANYGLVPNSYDVMLYWWVPDPTFLRRCHWGRWGTWIVRSNQVLAGSCESM